MKVGVRKPSIKKSVKARTTAKVKRKVKKAVIPAYGKKGTGIIKDPKKAIYNKIYNKTTISIAPTISDIGSLKNKRESETDFKQNNLESKLTSLSKTPPNHSSDDREDSIYNKNRYKWVLNPKEVNKFLIIFIVTILSFFITPLLLISLPTVIYIIIHVLTTKEITVLDTLTNKKTIMLRSEFKQLKNKKQ